MYITGSLFSRCMNLVYFTGHPYQHYPELPLPPLEERDGVLNTKAIFPYKVGLKISFSLKRGNLIWNGLHKKGIYHATYTNCFNIIMGVPSPRLIGYRGRRSILNL